MSTNLVTPSQNRCQSPARSVEMVNHPSHYQAVDGMEVIDVIEAFGLGFNLGNVCKYVLRAEKKFDALEDLKKAKWYLEREISNREKEIKGTSTNLSARQIK